ncbi:hypothetical protein GW17_00014669 [Ensete ventricosum]|nr:hypothetical protein GW17_00014669 [Ensete ventricosum]
MLRAAAAYTLHGTNRPARFCAVRHRLARSLAVLYCVTLSRTTPSNVCMVHRLVWARGATSTPRLHVGSDLAADCCCGGGARICSITFIWVFVDAGNLIRLEVALIQILSTSRGLIT